MNGTVAEILALERKFFTALEEGDSAAIAECYGPGMTVWTNVHANEISGAHHIAGLEEHFFGTYTDRKYIDRRTDLIEGGFVRQHVLTGFVRGEPVTMRICTICRVSNGKLVRIEEYLTFPPPMTA